jgi:hypothetical protein
MGGVCVGLKTSFPPPLEMMFWVIKELAKCLDLIFFSNFELKMFAIDDGGLEIYLNISLFICLFKKKQVSPL